MVFNNMSVVTHTVKKKFPPKREAINVYFLFLWSILFFCPSTIPAGPICFFRRHFRCPFQSLPWFLRDIQPFPFSGDEPSLWLFYDASLLPVPVWWTPAPASEETNRSPLKSF